ncbi:fibronectin type III domain-containing protein [Leptothermofonsia sp. ETS-13]|uniref:fibronectin type III domain-containing protein n=1 Tax=Leptothermofonsia sp. ETS-13 TaxID=3035696 RepID=UPI003BA2FB06
MSMRSSIGGVTVLSTYRKQAFIGVPCFVVAASAVLLPATGGAVVSNGQVFCYSDRPCIESVTSDARSIRISWRGREYFDFYNVRWIRPGKEEMETHKMLEGGNKGSLAITKILPNTQYVIKIQGCNTQLIGGPACTEWEIQEVVTQDFALEEEATGTQPAEGQPTGSATVEEPAVVEPASKQPLMDAPPVVVPTTEVPASETSPK